MCTGEREDGCWGRQRHWLAITSITRASCSRSSWQPSWNHGRRASYTEIHCTCTIYYTCMHCMYSDWPDQEGIGRVRDEGAGGLAAVMEVT